MYKVFIKDKPVFLTGETENIPASALKYKNKEWLRIVIQRFKEEDKSVELCIWHKDINLLWKTFCSLFTLINVAGGVLVNERKEMLFIFRLGKWDLPKGKIEKGEQPQEAAVREVEEECGINKINFKGELSPTYHVYELNKQEILKKCYWYIMEANSAQNSLKPQLEEHITEVKWMNRQQVQEALKNTYGSIMEVVQEYFENE